MAESVLLIGGGGREHALAMEMSTSPTLQRIYCAPGNAGTALVAKTENLPFGVDDSELIVDFALKHRNGLTVMIGPEAPLVSGLADKLRAEAINVFGPNAAAAKLEGSKAFASDFMSKYDIPQPKSHTVRTIGEAQQAIAGRTPQSFVLKADGLAGGKGVVLPTSSEQVDITLRTMLSGKGFESAGKNGVVIQERLSGPEVSVFVISDGQRHSVLPFFAQDHKRRDDGDLGPNTGGMGAYTPVPTKMISKTQLAKIQDIASRTITGMAKQGTPYQGVLYIGLMLAAERSGDPIVIEYNVRFGDPEAQVVLPALSAAGVDVYQMLRDTASGNVPTLEAQVKPDKAALSVCLAAAGYPEKPIKGEIIYGLKQSYPNVTIHHGGTKLVDKDTVTSGGRVLYVTGQGKTVDAAAAAAYAAIGAQGIHFSGMHYRTDIGHQARN